MGYLSPSLDTASDKSRGGGKPRDGDTSPRLSIASDVEDWEHRTFHSMASWHKVGQRLASKTFLETGMKAIGQGYTIIITKGYIIYHNSSSSPFILYVFFVNAANYQQFEH